MALPPTNEFNEKQKAFVTYYLTPNSPEYFNAAAAALKAGYSPHTARFHGSWLLTNPNIRNLIELHQNELKEIQKAAVKKVTVDADFLARKLVRAIELCEAEIKGSKGRIQMVDSKGFLGAIAILKDYTGGFDKNKQQITGGLELEQKPKPPKLENLTDDQLRLYKSLHSKVFDN